MDLLYAVLCGFVQGACEFLPISSSGHLALVHSMLKDVMPPPDAAFDVLLHFGTLFAVISAYRRDVYAICGAFFKMLGKVIKGRFDPRAAEPDEKLVIRLVLGTLPLALAALVDDKIEALASYPRVVGAMLILNGAMLLIFGKIKKGSLKCHEIGLSGALGVGLFQLAATVPGISRSGATISGCELFGVRRDDAVRFSFLLSIPAITGANVFSAIKCLDSSVAVDPAQCILGTATAAITGALAIKIIKKLAKSKKFDIFGIYCLIIGGAALIRG